MDPKHLPNLTTYCPSLLVLDAQSRTLLVRRRQLHHH